MVKDADQRKFGETTIFSADERREILDRILLNFEDDDRITGVLVVGSGAVGFDDDYSDIDLCIVIAKEADVFNVLRDWKGRIEDLFPVIQNF